MGKLIKPWVRHWLRGHNVDEWSISGQAPYLSCSCGATWPA